MNVTFSIIKKDTFIVILYFQPSVSLKFKIMGGNASFYNELVSILSDWRACPITAVVMAAFSADFFYPYNPILFSIYAFLKIAPSIPQCGISVKENIYPEWSSPSGKAERQDYLVKTLASLKVRISG